MSETAQSFVSHRSVPQLLCRNLRHAWKISRFEAVTDEEKSAIRMLKWEQVIARRVYCTRCDTERIEYFARDSGNKPFEKVFNRYAYTDNYVFKGGEGAPARHTYFDELLERHIF